MGKIEFYSRNTIGYTELYRILKIQINIYFISSRRETPLTH